MTLTAALPPLVAKEARGLAGVWLASLAAILAAAVVDVDAFRGLEVAVYVTGVTALGALSMGQEYTHRTLPALLSQPIRRERLFLAKLAVLGAMLVSLSALAVVTVDADGDVASRPFILVVPVLVGLGLTPWLTMICRSAIAGAVFAPGLVGLMMTLVTIWQVVRYGHGPSLELQAAVLWYGTPALCAAGAVMGWRTFMRLEAVDGPPPAIWAPWSSRARTAGAVAPPVSRRHPAWMLVKKELRLQQMTYAVGGLYVLGWLVVWALMPLVPQVYRILNVLTLFYCALIAVLAGSLAIAEERQLGTLTWHALLPLPAWQPWAIKVAIVLGLALGLGLGVPQVLLPIINPPGEALRIIRPLFAGAVTVFAVIGLHLSSVSTSGLQAMVLSVPAIVLSFVPVSLVAGALISVRFAETTRLSAGTLTTLALLLLVSLGAFVLRLAFSNQRSPDLAGGRPWAQMAAVVTCVSVGTLLLTVLAALS